MKKFTNTATAAALLAGLSSFSAHAAIPTDSSTNVLLIIADDVGVDNISVYNEQPNHMAQTPNIDDLANDGVFFRNAWASPKCAPARASIYSGRYGKRTGVTHVGNRYMLDGNEKTSAEYLTGKGYATALFGKWHIGHNAGELPTDQGYQHFSGAIANISNNVAGLRNTSYWNWDKTVLNTGDTLQTSATTTEPEYATQVNTEEATTWINQQNQPWFATVAYNAGHSPFEIPPNNTYSSFQLFGKAGRACKSSAKGKNNKLPATPENCYRAMVETMDHYINQLLTNINDISNTLVIVIGDNGTPGAVTIAETGLPFASDHAKNTVYEGGVNVPIAMAYYDNAGNRSRYTNAAVENTDNVEAVDLFSTILHTANATTDSGTVIDGQTLLAHLDSNLNAPASKATVYTELTDKNEDRWTVSNGSSKYIYNDGTEECYDLTLDAAERDNEYAKAAPNTHLTSTCDNLKLQKP